MKALSDLADIIAREIGLDQEECERRMAFLEFSEKDTEVLRQVHALLQQSKEGFSEAFYDHLLKFPELQALIPDDATLNRLRQAQSAYFDSLTAGEYGSAYVFDRLRVGVAHQRIGLEPKWYIGAYRKYASEMLSLLWRSFRDRPERFLDAYNAVLKMVRQSTS